MVPSQIYLMSLMVSMLKVYFVALNVQLQIFNLVSLIIDRLGEKIVPCVEKILAFLPQVSQQLTMILLFVYSNLALVFVFNIWSIIVLFQNYGDPISECKGTLGKDLPFCIEY